MNTKRIFFASVVVWIFGILYTMLTCGWLFSWVYTIPPVIWKSPEMMATPTYMILSLLVGLVSSFIFVAVFALLYKGIPLKGLKKGLLYGFLAWLIGPFVGIVGMPIYMMIANTVIIYWLINFFIAYLVMGLLTASIYKER